ncbi:MAG: peptidoglycan DD-metalloendopeptidase family protein [Pseudomonadales bacterium]|nr:peptidoglycan DD-metalloendopeptidase family protein [Pseudomonadales bacterium]
MLQRTLQAIRIPRPHQRMATAVAIVTLLFVSTGFVPEQPQNTELTIEPMKEVAQIEATTETVVEEVSADLEHTHIVKQGDNMAMIFGRNNLSPKTLYALTRTQHGAALAGIFPGAELRFQRQGQELVKLTYQAGPLESIEFSRDADGTFSSKEVVRVPEKVLTYKHGRIESSLFLTSQEIGLPDSLTMRLAQIFQWDIDFVLDIRPGDEFFALIEEQYLNGEFIGYGDILDARFINQNNMYTAVRFEDEDGSVDFFDPSGLSMRKAFLRAPVDFSRISSSFNMRRKHPLHNTIRPHRGIDYAAPRGTPILAAGDGRIKTASRTQANGNFVVIRHGEQFVTKYLHLSKFGRNIKSGRKVQQGQTIGYVGSTGWATGPHLHYEFLVNGVHQNPRTVKLPEAEPVAAGQMANFKTSTYPNIVLLDHFADQVALALAEL